MVARSMGAVEVSGGTLSAGDAPSVLIQTVRVASSQTTEAPATSAKKRAGTITRSLTMRGATSRVTVLDPTVARREETRRRTTTRSVSMRTVCVAANQ